MKSSRLEEDTNTKDNTIKDVRNLFTLKKLKEKTNYTAIKYIRIFFQFEKYNKVIQDIILKDIRNFFEHEEEENYFYKPVKVKNFWNNNYIKYKSNCNRKTLSVKNILIKLSHT